ncbi:hypothetical protein QCA50_016907 [Cerrena zonata]|uniref:Uncharacterized protein n=1 Tax=Cerrena zonata TaxID=2478898 RepID=A0AAW0FGQ8_9APHY
MAEHPTVKRYFPDNAFTPLTSIGWHLGDSDWCFLPQSEKTRTIFIIATSAAFVAFGIQLIPMVISLRALWISTRTSPSRIIKYLVVHTCALEIVNIIGLLTAALSFRLYFGSFQDLWARRTCFNPTNNEDAATYINPRSDVDADLDEWERWRERFRVLNIISTVAFGLCGMLTDGMLLWRCHQIWKFTLFSRPKLIIVIPMLLFVASAVSLCFSGIGDPPTGFSLFLYFIISMTLNITLTSLIILRLLRCRAQTQKALGNQHGRHYNMISIMFVESAFMSFICSVLILASFQDNIASNFGMTLEIWVAVTPAVQACANHLIVYRGARGFYGSWKSDDASVETQSTVAFSGSQPTADLSV